MSMKLERRSEKKSKTVEKNLVAISIKLSDFENVKYLNQEVENLQIDGKFMNKKIESSNCFRCLDEDINLEFKLSINIDNDEEIFNLFSNPIELILMTCDECSIVLGITNIDLIKLCSDQVESQTFRLKFERENIGNNIFPMFRTISFSTEISSDKAILKNGLDNSLSITFETIYNLDTNAEENSKIDIGFMAPINQEFKKSFTFSHKMDSCLSKVYCPSKAKRWLTLSHISGKGAESTYNEQSYDPPKSEYEEKLLRNVRNETKLKSLGRIILPTESNNFLKNHIENSFKIAIEVMQGTNHLIGFVNLDQLLQVDVKRIKTVVPLKKFNDSELKQKCNYESVFFKPKKSSRKDKRQRSTVRESIRSTTENDEENEEIDRISEEIFLNEDCSEVFVIIEFELEKAFNEKIEEDSVDSVILEEENSLISKIIPDEKIESLMDKLQVITTDIFKVYGRELSVNEILFQVQGDGYLDAIEDQTLSNLCNIQAHSADENFDDFKANLWCEVSSKGLNKKYLNHKSKLDDILKAQLYDFLGINKKAQEIFLRRIYENKTYENWIDYAIYVLRKESFNKALACLDKAIAFDPISLIGHILQAYIFFKLKKYSECERIIISMEEKRGSSAEISMIRLIIKTSMVDAVTNLSEIKNHSEFQKVYESRELLWSGTNEDKFLNWDDPFIKLSVFFIKLGCYDFAEFSLNKFYATRGENYNYSYLLAVIDAIRGNFADALIHLRKISQQPVKEKYEKVQVFKALMLMKLGKHETAMKLCKSSIFNVKNNLDKFLVTFVIGKHLRETQDFAFALKLLKLASEVFPCEMTLTELGQCLMKLNKLSAAEKCFHKAITIDPSTEEPWRHLIEIYKKQNRMSLVKLCNKNCNCV